MWPPSVLAGMTLTQIACLCVDRPPGEAGRIGTWEEMAAELARKEAEDREWARPGSGGR
jgi:hypothetical protein